MMTEQQSDYDLFTVFLDALYDSTAKEGPLANLRSKSWNLFQTMGLPQRKDELFKYINLSRFYSSEYSIAETTTIQASDLEPLIEPECSNSLIVFVNGYFQPELSRTSALPPKMVVLKLSEAMRTYGALLNNQWIKSAKEEKDPFVLLNGACHGEGAFIYLPPKVECEHPLQLLYLVDSPSKQTLISPRLQIFAGASSSLKLIATHTQAGQACFINQVTEINLEENANLHYTQINSPLSEEIYHFDATRALLKADSSLKTVCVTRGSRGIRHDYKVVLAGQNSEACLNGVWILKEKREAHYHVHIEHVAPNCRSNQLFKGVLHDAAHSSFDGKIIVGQLAQQTNAFQLNNNLLLSDGAKAESSPNLKIYADDVKASHGATIGQLPEEELFYLRTRGMSVEQAKKLLVDGFCQEVIDLLPLESLRLKNGC